MIVIQEVFTKLETEHRTMADEIRELDYQHWIGIIALATKAECAADLNTIISGLGRLFELVGRGYPLDFWDVLRGETYIQIENAITQWADVTAGFNEHEWDLPDGWRTYSTWSSEYIRIFKKDDNTIITWHDLEGKYIECKRAGEEVKA